MLSDLLKEWYRAKADEVTAKLERRHIEDQILEQSKETEFKIFDGTLRIKRRRKYDVDEFLLHDLCLQHRLDTEQRTLFSWHPTLKEGEWWKASQGTRDILSPAIQIKESRPTFQFQDMEL